MFTRATWVVLSFTGLKLVKLGYNRFRIGYSGWYSVLLGLLSLPWFLPSFTEFYRVLLGFREFGRMFTRATWVVLSFTGLNLVKLGYNRFHIGYSGWYWVLLGLLSLPWFLPSFTEFYRVLPSFTGF